MRIDIVSVFPRFFDVLELSLLGKARRGESLTSSPTIFATGRTILIERSTTLRLAAAREW